MEVSRKQKLMDTALALFERNGFHATGIDRILAESGVAKMTLYKHFRSKDELIVAALRGRDAQFREWFRSAVEAKAKAPKKRLLAVFDVLEEWYSSPGFHGCVFISAACEYGERDNPVLATAAENKALMRAYLAEIAGEAGAADAEGLADQFMLLMDGATVTAQLSGDPAAARRARRVAKVLLKNAGM